jgi:hypothetical protein
VAAGSNTVTCVSLPNEVDCVVIYACTPGNCIVGGGAEQIGGPVSTDASGICMPPVSLSRPLMGGEYIFAYDTCSGRMGPLDPVSALLTEAPAMSSKMIGVLAGTLALIGLFGLLRLRRDL